MLTKFPATLCRDATISYCHGRPVVRALSCVLSLVPRSWPCRYLHHCIEALRLSFSDTRWYIADPEHSDIPLTGMLSKVRLQLFAVVSPVPAMTVATVILQTLERVRGGALGLLGCASPKSQPTRHYLEPFSRGVS